MLFQVNKKTSTPQELLDAVIKIKQDLGSYSIDDLSGTHEIVISIKPVDSHE